MGIVWFFVLEETVKPESSGAPIGYVAALLAAVVTLFGCCCALIKYIRDERDKHEKKVESMYMARLDDLEKVSSKSSTVEDVTIKKLPKKGDTDVGH
jgi:hypothetical protein